MTQVAPAPSITGPAAIRAIPSGNSGQSGFSLALTAPQPPRAPPPSEARVTDPKRHAIAGPGKELPEEGETADTEEEHSEVDAPFAWFGIALTPPPEAAPAIVAFGQPVASADIPEGEAAATPAIALPDGLTDPIVTPETGETVAPDAPTPDALAPEAPSPTFDLTAKAEAPTRTRQIQGIDISRLGRGDLPAKIELPVGSPLLQTIAALQPSGSEAQPFAALAASAGIEMPEQFRRPAPRDPVINALTPTSATEMLRPNVVQAVGDAQQAAIDMRRGEWMSQTIDRIEALRDSPSSRETSIRLSPDALGTVDVSIRHEGDRIHVRFAAENAQARALLTEAQSRLTEIAEARGIKLGSASVDAGPSGQGQRHNAAPGTTPFSTAPVSVTGGDTATVSDAAAGRVA